jgi:hypothetical protein
VDLLDLPALHNLRGQVVSFDSIQQVTRGNPFRARAFLDYLDPARGIYTALVENNGKIDLVGQIVHLANSRSSNLSCIAPVRGLTGTEMGVLLDHLAMQAGEWGTYHLLVEADEHSNAFDVFRSAGFSVYAWQRIWRYAAEGALPPDENEDYIWTQATERDQIAIRSLYQSLVPALVQPVENLFDKHPTGVLCKQECNLIGYADIISGREGTWVQPYIHPEVKDVHSILTSLLRQVGRRTSRSVFICVRSYQAWIETALEELPVLASPRQALMVKHLALSQRVTVPIGVPSFEQTSTKASVVRAEPHK